MRRFIVSLRKDHGLGSNTILHAVIIGQFLKRHGRGGITREIPLPECITPLVKVYPNEELAPLLCNALQCGHAMFLLSGFCEQEVVYPADVVVAAAADHATAQRAAQT